MENIYLICYIFTYMLVLHAAFPLFFLLLILSCFPIWKSVKKVSPWPTLLLLPQVRWLDGSTYTDWLRVWCQGKSRTDILTFRCIPNKWEVRIKSFSFLPTDLTREEDGEKRKESFLFLHQLDNIHDMMMGQLQRTVKRTHMYARREEITRGNSFLECSALILKMASISTVKIINLLSNMVDNLLKYVI